MEGKETGQKNRADLLQEVQELHSQLKESNNIISAIRGGEVDAFLVSEKRRDQVYILQGADPVYREIVEEMQEGFITLNQDGVIVFCNNSFARIIGHSMEKVIGSSIYSLLSPAESESFRILLTGKSSFKREFCINSPNGLKVPVLVSSKCCFDKEQLTYMIITDLTEQKRSAQQFMNRVFEQAGEAIVVCDLSGRIIRINNAATALFGADLLQRDFDHAMRLQTADSVEPFSLQNALQKGNVDGIEVSYSSHDDRRLTFSLRAGWLTGAGPGERIGFLVTLADMTGRKQAEEALRRNVEMHAELNKITKTAKSAARFRNFIENLPLPMSIIGKDEKLVYINTQFTHVFGYTLDEIPTLTAWRKLAYPDIKYRQWVAETWDAEVKSALHGDKAEVKPIELNVTCKNGEVRAVLVSGSVEAGTTIATFTDVTARHLHERMLQVAYERRRKSDLFNEMVRESLPSEQTLFESARLIGPGRIDSISCCLIVIDEYREMAREKRSSEYIMLVDSIIDALEGPNRIVWENPEGVGVLCLEELPAGEAIREQKKQAEGLRQEIARRLPQIKVSIGIAEVTADVAELASRFRQAVVAVTTGSKVWPKANTYHYLEMGVFQLLSSFKDEAKIDEYIERTIGKLLHYDKKKSESYLATLEILLTSDNLKQAAEDLFIHYHTLLFRKQRLEKILGLSFNDLSTRLSILSALYLMKLQK